MAAAKRKKSPQKKTLRRKNNRNALWFIVIFLILLIASLFIGYYFTHKNSKEKTETLNQNKQVISTKKTSASLPKSTKTNILDGTWVSEYDGAIMEISGTHFTLEFPSVNSGEIIHGLLKTKEGTVHFLYQTGSNTCKGFMGKYNFELKNKNLIFNKISDKCKSRTDRMNSGWYAL